MSETIIVSTSQKRSSLKSYNHETNSIKPAKRFKSIKNGGKESEIEDDEVDDEMRLEDDDEEEEEEVVDEEEDELVEDVSEDGDDNVEVDHNVPTTSSAGGTGLTNDLTSQLLTSTFLFNKNLLLSNMAQSLMMQSPSLLVLIFLFENFGVFVYI